MVISGNIIPNTRSQMLNHYAKKRKQSRKDGY